LIIIVAVVATFAIVRAADILGRLMATGKAVSAGIISPTTPQPARQHLPDGDSMGVVYAVRGGEQPMYLFAAKAGTTILAASP
jgi:hypothetical protein